MRGNSFVTLFLTVVVSATTMPCACAADEDSAGRSVPGSVTPSTGTTPGQTASAPEPAAQTKPGSAPAAAGSMRRGERVDCPSLRRRYAESQACFSRYRLKNGGLKPEAFRHCREIENPALKCGSAVVD